MWSSVWTCVLLCVLQRHSVWCYSNAKLGWQLGDRAGAVEKVSSVDAEHPKMTDLMTVGSGHPSLTYRAFSFDGTDDYVQVIINNNGQFRIFSLFLLVYPTLASGTLVHYRYSSGGTNGIDEIVISIESGTVKFQTIYNSTEWTFTHPTEITLHAWHRLVFKRDMDNEKIHLDLDGISSTHYAAPRNIVEYLGVPGELWLGQNIDSGNFFKGKMTCVLFYDYVFANENTPLAYSECNGMFTSPGPSQVIDVDTLVRDPVTMWRLDNTTFGYSIMGAAPQYPPESQCSRLADGCPEIPFRQSLMLDGSSVSYLDLNLSFGVLQGDFQIVLFVKPGYPSSGTILHFRYTGTETGIRDVKLSARSSNITLSLCHSPMCCDSLVHTALLTADMWHFVAIERSGGNIGMVIDDSYVTDAATCAGGSTNVREEGMLRVGLALDDDDGFRGSITCMALYDYVSPGADMKSNHISYCQDLEPSQSVFDTEVCSQAPPLRHKYYSLELENVEPDVNVSAIMTSASASLRQCSSLCIASKYCVAFTFSGLSSQKLCSLYDYVTQDGGLRTKSKSKYYVIK